MYHGFDRLLRIRDGDGNYHDDDVACHDVKVDVVDSEGGRAFQDKNEAEKLPF